MDNENSTKIINNARKSALHGTEYDVFWRKPQNTVTDKLEAYAKVRVDFIDYGMRKHVRPDRPLDILDLGCGSGWLTAVLANYGNAIGIDFAPETIQAAQQRYGIQARYLLAQPDSVTLGLPDDAKFDLVVASEVLEHVEDHSAFISQVVSFLKPAGWFVLTTPNQRYWKYYLKNERYQIYGQPIENWVTIRECATLLETNGFEIIWREGWADNGGYTLANKMADNRYIRKLAKLTGVYHQYARLILPVCMFQMVLARRIAT